MSKPTKTVLIYDQCGIESLHFFVVDGDYRHLDGTYINAGDDEASQEKLSALLKLDAYPDVLPHLERFPVDAVKEGAVVIVCGFVP